MDENPRVDMETDVSSTTNDEQNTQEVSETHGNVQTVIVVEEVLEEDMIVDSGEESPLSEKSDNEKVYTSNPTAIKDTESSKTNISPQKDIQCSTIAMSAQKDVMPPKTVALSQKEIPKLKIIISPRKDLQNQKMVTTQNNIQAPKTFSSPTKEEHTFKIVISPQKDTHGAKAVVNKNNLQSSMSLKEIGVSKSVISPRKDIQSSKTEISRQTNVQSSKTVISPQKDALNSKTLISPQKDVLISNTIISPVLNIPSSTTTLASVQRDKQTLKTVPFPIKDSHISKPISPQKDTVSSETNSSTMNTQNDVNLSKISISPHEEDSSSKDVEMVTVVCLEEDIQSPDTLVPSTKSDIEIKFNQPSTGTSNNSEDDTQISPVKHEDFMGETVAIKISSMTSKPDDRIEIDDPAVKPLIVTESKTSQAEISCIDNPKTPTKELTEKKNVINKDKKDQIICNVSVDVCEKSNDSHVESSLDFSEKEHNKSISRELKSLIKSAKESKIISECTQLTSKTRKSRTLDSSTSSLNTSIDPDKIHTRRSSDQSQLSTSSDPAEKVPMKRSMRSQNPEFVNKVKLFLNSVTGKHPKAESDDESQEDVKKDKSDNTPSSPKKKKLSQKDKDVQEKEAKLRSDPYCWRCHWAVEQVSNEKGHPPLQCKVCPRSFHYKCLSATEKTKITSDTTWVCPECLVVLHAESSETRSPSMKKISLGRLCELLQYALERMMDLNGVEPFMQPVDRTVFPDYEKYVVHPKDLTMMKANIAEGLYGSTEAFLADAQWILHNSIIFNTLQSKLTGGARALVRTCRAEIGEIEACPECYAAAHARRPTWFTDVCTTPHILLWAKLKGFPYWPAKGMTVSNQGMVDVRFFGAHDRAWVPAKDCFLYSEKDPNNFRTKRQDILDSMQEAEQHIRNISRKYGKFVYPPFKTQFDPTKLTEQLKMMIPTFEGELRGPKAKAVSSSPNNFKNKSRSNSKSSKGSAIDGEISETEESQTTPTRKMSGGAEIAGDEDYSIEKNKVQEVETPKDKLSQRKRRRSELEEAVITIIEKSSTTEKKRRLESTNKDDKNVLQQDNKNKINDKSKNKDVDKERNKKDTSLNTTKEVDKKASNDSANNSVTEKTPVKLLKKIKIFKASTPKEKEEKGTLKHYQAIEIKKAPQKEKEKSEDSKEKRRHSRNKSVNASHTTKEKDIDRKIKNSEPKNDKDSYAKNKEIELDKPINITKPTTSDNSRSFKDRLQFDDDTTLAVIAREASKTNGTGLPTISSVRSLSTAHIPKNKTLNDSNKSIDTVQDVNSNSSSTDNVHNTVQTLQKQRSETGQPQVGRVGVRAFARMTSPDKSQPKERVEVEIKAEPIDLDDSDRQSEKLDLMNVFHLRPVNPPQSNLRDVRINKVVVAPLVRKAPAKPPEVRVKARKTFPQPKKPDDGRSELNGKNSMVYIPIQPPTTQATVRPNRPITVNPAAAVRTHVTTITSNVATNIVNPVTTQIVSMPSLSLPTTSTTVVSKNSTMACMPTVGQIPTTVHTVPLITSVNGQCFFSLQPVMSVGGVDNQPQPPIVNGLSERNTSALVPVTASTSHTTGLMTSVQPITNGANGPTTPADLPRLQQRPVIHNPLDSTLPLNYVPPPSTAGPLTAKLNQNAIKLTDFFRTLLEDTLDKIEEPVAQLTSMKLQLEQTRWRYQQELKELKHNHELTVVEMRTSFEKEKLRALSEVRRIAQLELETAIKNTKAKQWCANCSQEAHFYCCWNTAYCDYPCQRSHWARHYSRCTQQQNQDSSEHSLDQRLQPAPDNLPRNASTPTLTVGGKLAPARVYSKDGPAPKPSIIVSMVDDSNGGQSVKCVGTFKPGQQPVSSVLLNKQVITSEEAAKKVVTSGGYLLVGASPAAARRPHCVQYYS